MNRYRALEELDIEFKEAESAWLEAQDDAGLSDQEKQQFLSRLHQCLEKRKAHISTHWSDPAYYEDGKMRKLVVD
ncbi:hypothetical protein [Parendozoicomonas haliclonae]|uniref:Uncharacterized protein n=1 Tax=Parendozoicomonas haliclonae TaxID=1960125 RepID=A0A1X7APE4_9GAMM|nr:hypothetical protein [Parendozoicomonas haliclonae]SMA50156.1 hypothetical protein EHSB41UT_03947 [Parendozoicomonas haliclonae]